MSTRSKLVVVVLLVAMAAGSYLFFRQHESNDGELVLYGNVDVREVELAFRRDGRLASMSAEEGRAVRKGELLAELDPQPYRESLAVAEAELRAAEAELLKLERGNRTQDIRRAEEAVRQAEAVFQRTESEFRRQAGLAVNRNTSEQALEAARTARDEAAAALSGARQTLSLQREGARSEDIAAAEARVAAAEATRAQAVTALEDTKLLSPADATVLARVREPGSMVGSRDAVYTLSLRDPVYVRAYVSEPQLGRVAPGASVRIRTDSSGKVYQGHVGFISPRAEFTPKSVETTDLRTDLVYRLRIVVEDDDEGLLQGMPVTVEVDAPPAHED
jgi:HlyD family secretion protein